MIIHKFLTKVSKTYYSCSWIPFHTVFKKQRTVNALIRPEILQLLEKNGMPQNTGTGKDFLKDSKISGNNTGK